MDTIHINVSKPYDVLVGEGILRSVASLVEPVCASKRLAIVTDDIVDRLYGETVQRLLEDGGFTVLKTVFPNGESSKNAHTLTAILEFLAQNHIRRNDALIALGGGVVGDITGFAAAVYMRGIRVIQVPTTLLAMVDSSVGGKTAIDLTNGKNLVGAFWQPSLVICDTSIARDLPPEIFSQGMAEVIKCNVIRSLPIIEYIERGTLDDHLPNVIRDCIVLKRDIVEQDEYDQKGIRNLLNVGHTVAHAVEKLSEYRVSHGMAVGIGMVKEAEMAQRMGLCTGQTVEKIRYAVERYGLTQPIPWDAAAIADAMKSDKKNRDSGIVFEFPIALGSCKEAVLSKEQVLSLWE